MTEPMKMAAAHVSKEFMQAIDKLADMRGVERTKIIRWALIEYLKKHGIIIAPDESSDDQEQAA